MKLPKNLLNTGTYTKPRIFLCETNKERICELETFNTNGTFKFNSYSELSFEVGRVYNNIINGNTTVNPYYDKIEAFRLISIEGFGYFELQGPELSGDGIQEKKVCNAYSLEYTLSQKYLEDFYINTGEIGSVEVTYAEDYNNGHIIPVTLYNPSNTKLSLLHLALEKVYGNWTIGHVDSSLQTLSRQFEVDRESIYDFLMNEVCKKFNCYITFDTINNTINLYAESLTSKFIGDGSTNTFTISPPFSEIGTVSVGGYKTTRWNYDTYAGVLTLEDAPESGAYIEVIDGALTKWETDVFVSFDNLSQEMNINYDADSIKTQLNITFGDNNNIREVNLGMPYITDLSYYHTVDWMGQDLYDAYTKYLQKINQNQSLYTNNSQKMLDISGCIDFEENRLSLGYSIVQSVGPETVGTYYVRGGTSPNYYYTEVSLPSEYNANTTYYRIDTTNLTEEKVKNLFTVLKKYFNNENEDNNSGDTKITSWKTELDKLSSDFQFMNTYTLTYLSTELAKVNTNRIGNKSIVTAINNFLSEMFNEIGRIPLKQLYLEPYKKVQVTNVDAGWSQKDNENYGYYYPVVLMLDAINGAIKKRDTVVSDYEEQYSTLVKKNADISNSLAMSENFTKDQLIRLSAFLREDELQIDDIVITSEDSIADTFKVQQDAMESGRIELQKLSQPQLQFTMSMANIYALPEFEPIINQFQLGKVIKVGLRSDYIKQSRLMQVNINFDDFSDFSVEFGELTNLRTQSDIHADLLKNAISAGKSVAQNESYWSKGASMSGDIQDKINAGLLDAIDSIKSMDGTQGVEIDKYGIHLRKIDPVTGEADPEQGWITNNKFLYSDDGFETTKSVFGKYTYDGNSYYGILAEAIVGSLIVGTQMEIGNQNGTLKFNDDGLLITNGSSTFQIDPKSQQLINLSDGTNDIFYLDDDGKLHVVGDGNKLDISVNTTVSEIKQTEEEIKLSVKNETQRAQTIEGQLQQSITSASAEIKINSDAIESEVKRAKSVESKLEQQIQDTNTRITQTADEIKLEANNNLTNALKNYSTTTEMNSAITLKADSITSEVNDFKKYVDDNYSTTTEINSVIEQKADSITSEVSKTYATIGQVAHYGTCGTAADVVAKVVTCSGFSLYKGATVSVKFTYATAVDKPTLNVNNTGAKYITIDNTYLYDNSAANWSAKSVVCFVYNGTYWDIVDSGSLSKIKQTADAITAEVTRATGVENELSSQIKINANAITSKVNNGDFGTLIEQNYNHVKIAWNKNSDYIQFENGSMNIYTSSSDHSTDTLLMKQTSTGTWYYNAGTTIGKIGTNKFSDDSGYKGLVFDLENTASYMCWAAKDNDNDTAFSVKLIYHHKSSRNKKGLHFSCDTYADGNLYLTDSNRFKAWSSGGCGFDGKMTWCNSSNATSVEIDGNNTLFNIYNGVSVNFYTDIDMHGYDILNQSDARLKTNIHDTQIDALSAINQIEMKEFDWIENGEHEDIGVIAQQLQTILPDLVHEDESTGKLSIKINKFIPYLIKSIQELTDYITGGVSTFSLNRSWIDPYTEEEKTAFVTTNSCYDKNKTLEELERPKILIPIETQGEESNE